MAARETFRDRFRLLLDGRTSVLFDLHTGRFDRLNASATVIARALESGREEDAVEALISNFRVARSVAERDVQVFVAALGRRTRSRTLNDIVFRRDGSGLTMCMRGHDVGYLAGGGRRWSVSRTPSKAAAREVLLWMVPHVLTLAGEWVLHASSFVQGGSCIAIIGASGAGKTTTARAFANAGQRIASEDLLRVRPAANGLVVLSESRIHSWVDAHCEAFARGDCVIADDLIDDAGACATPIAQLWVISASQRVGTELTFTELSKSAAFATFVTNSFAEAGDPTTLDVVFGLSAALTAHCHAWLVQMPDGIASLYRAAEAYSVNTAS